MKRVSIKIEGKVYPIKFGYGAMIILAKWLKLKTYQDVVDFLKVTFSKGKPNEYLTFEMYDILGKIALSGIKNYNSNANVTTDEIIDEIIKDNSLIPIIMEAHYATLPKKPNPIQFKTKYTC